MRRLLVLTDVGEEIDDEAALWMLTQHLRNNSDVEADVVFTTGNTVQRAMRWGEILATLEDGAARPSGGRLRYFLGPRTARHVRYPGSLGAAELGKVGMSGLHDAEFVGGLYDVVLQISPLEGFGGGPGPPPPGPEGALWRVHPRPGAIVPMLIVVGGEGATNFPLDELHTCWKALLVERGFRAVHVEQKNYVRWTPEFFGHMPPGLVDVVLEDEWNKSVGRIPPSAASLMVRFRVNAQVNYDVVARAYDAFCTLHGRSSAFAEATGWCRALSSQLREWVAAGYVRRSREADEAAGAGAQGNARISARVPGQTHAWEAMMSEGCARDVRAALEGGPAPEGRARPALPDLSVDEAMGWAVHLMTTKLLTIAAWDAFACDGAGLSLDQVREYVLGTGARPPLDWRGFPPLRGDLAAVRREVVGNPMYDPCGMLVALAVVSSGQQASGAAELLRRGEALAPEEVRVGAVKASMGGCKGSDLAERLLGAAAAG